MPKPVLRSFLLLLGASLLILALQPGVRAEETGKPPALVPFPNGAEIYFRDSFMRENPEEGEWKRISGKWEFDQMAKPGVSANPFSVVGSSRNDAMLVTGYNWWQNYYFNAALRTPPIFNTFGSVICYRGEGNYIFFGFSEKAGLILDQYVNGKVKNLWSQQSFPVSYQWYDVGMAIYGRKLVAMLDRRAVYTCDLEYDMSGQAGVLVTGASDYGMTVDDCSATGFPYTVDEMLTDSQQGFTRLLASERLNTPKFPSFFEKDKLMKKWASYEADWLPFEVPPAEEGKDPPTPTKYHFPLPLFNDVAMQIKFPDAVRKPIIELRKQSPDGTPGPVIFTINCIPSSNRYTVNFTTSSGRVLFNEPDIAGIDSVLEFMCEGDNVTFGVVKGPHFTEQVPGLGSELRSGVRIVINSETFEIVQFGSYNIDSSSFMEDTFYNSPTNWITAFGKWEIGSRWACNPIYTYLSSWDRMSSQLYSKHLFGGEVYCELWFSPKMASLCRPCYYPIQWFSLSNPTEAGDLSTGYTCAIATPDSNSMTLFRDGKDIDKITLRGAMSGGNLHHTWFHVIQQRLANGLSYDLNFIDERDDPRVFTVSDKQKQDLSPRPLVIWNSLTGLTVTRIRLTAQQIVWGGMKKDVYETSQAPCGVSTSAVTLDKDNQFAAPHFDFSKGSAGWYVASTQPALQVSAYPNSEKRSGLAVTSQFCGSRMEYVSPDMKVDARAWQSLNIKFKTDVSLDLYIHSGSRKFRLSLDSDKKADRFDWAIPVGKRYYVRGKSGIYNTVKIDLVQMFEEYQTLDIPPIIDKLTLERIDDSEDSLGVTSRDKMFYALAEVWFTSPFKSDTTDAMLYFNGDPGLNESVKTFVGGYSQEMITLTPLQIANSLPKQGEKEIIERSGALILEFKDGMKGLSPLGAVDETLLWRRRENKEDVLIAHKSDAFGFLGLKLLPEPLPMDQYPAMTIKATGNPDLFCIGIKCGDWSYFPLRTSTKCKVGAAEPKVVTLCPVVVIDDDTFWVTCYFPNIPKFADYPIVEEIIIGSINAAPPQIGTSLSISSVVFYDPAKISKFASLGGATITAKRAGKTLAEIQEAKVRNKKTFLINVSTPSQNIPSLVDVVLRDERLALTFDKPVSPGDLSFQIGDQELTWQYFRYADNAKVLFLERDEVFNSKEGSTPWTVKIGGKKIGSGFLDLPELRPPAIHRVNIIPEDSLVFEDYEYGMGTSGSRGTPIFLADAFPFMGHSYLENLDPGVGNMKGFLVRKNIDAVRYPNMTFAIRINKALVNLHFKCEGHFKDVQLSPSDTKPGKSYWTQGVFGSLPSVKLDDRWRVVRFNILDKLQGTPFNGKYFITEIALDTFMKFEAGGSVCIDNLCIYGDKSSYHTIVVEPPNGFDPKTKFQYEWWYADQGNMPMTLTQVSDTPTFRANMGGDSPAKIRIRLHINGKPSSVITDVGLP